MPVTFPIGKAAIAANTKPRIARRWIDNQVIKLRGLDKVSTGSGDCVGLSRPRALQIALCVELMATGMALQKAADVALEFTDFGNQGRPASALFPTGKTWLVIRPTGAVVVNADFDASISDLSAHSVSVIALDLNRLVARVDVSLNQ
jgi:hypothetical protein